MLQDQKSATMAPAGYPYQDENRSRGQHGHKRLELQREGQGQQKTEIAETALKVLELSQHLKKKWLSADIAEKRVILEIVCLNLVFKNATLDITMRKPFDAIAEGLNLKIGAEERT